MLHKFKLMDSKNIFPTASIHFIFTMRCANTLKIYFWDTFSTTFFCVVLSHTLSAFLSELFFLRVVYRSFTVYTFHGHDEPLLLLLLFLWRCLLHLMFADQSFDAGWFHKAVEYCRVCECACAMLIMLFGSVKLVL